MVKFPCISPYCVSHLWVCLGDVLEHGGDGDGFLGAEPRLLAPQLHAAVPTVRYERLRREDLQRRKRRGRYAQKGPGELPLMMSTQILDSLTTLTPCQHFELI